MKHIRNYLNIKVVFLSFTLASIVSCIGDWIYPNFIFIYGLSTVYIIASLASPALVFWFVKKINMKQGINIFFKYSISIFIGLLLSFFISRKVFLKIGDNYLKNAAIKTELYVKKYQDLYDSLPKTTNQMIDSSLVHEDFIYTRYIRLIQISIKTPDKSISLGNGYALSVGFWIADFRIWNPDIKAWVYVL